MNSTIEFFYFFFWICFFIFFFNYNNLLRLLIIAELIWGIFYLLYVLSSLNTGLISELSFSFFILVFASFEFVIGIMLIRFLKSLKNDSMGKSQNIVSSKIKKLFINNFKI